MQLLMGCTVSPEIFLYWVPIAASFFVGCLFAPVRNKLILRAIAINFLVDFDETRLFTLCESIHGYQAVSPTEYR